MGYSYDYLDSQSLTADSFVEIPDSNYSIYTELTCTQGMIFFKREELNPIAFSSIQNFYVDGKRIDLMGTFYSLNQLVKKISITLYNKSLQDQFVRLISSYDENSITGKLTLTNEETSREFDVILKKTNNRVEVSDSLTKKHFLVIEKGDPLYLSNNVLLIISSRGYPYYLTLDSGHVQEFFSDFKIVKDCYFHFETKMSGSLGDLYFKDKAVSVLVYGEDIYLFVNYYQSYSFSLSQLKACFRHNDGRITFQFTTSSGEVSFITWTISNKRLKSLLLKNEELVENIVMMDDEPFECSMQDGMWKMYQSEKNEFFILVNEVESIEVLNNKSIENVVAFNISNTQSYTITISCHENYISHLIGTTYKVKKYPLLKSAKPNDLYFSWSRQVNDFLLFNLFGQLVILQRGIEEIQQRSHLPAYKKNEQILNFMYYAIREQKHILDKVAIQFPETLMSEECSFFSNIDGNGYELLQKKLLSLSSQVQRHLIEIENSLNVLSFAIIPKKTYEQHTENKAKRNYWNAAVIGGLGVLTGGLGLIAAGGLIGLSTYFENKENKAVKQLRDENEQYKIDFYVERALDSFYHLMNTMLPYYVSQASKAYYSVAKEHRKRFMEQSDTSNVKSKQAMFNRLVDMYTSKKLPLNKGNLLNSEMIIKELVAPKNNRKNKLIGSLSE